MTGIINKRYQLKNQLGQGGMGIVYRAYDRLTGTDVALKQVTTPQNSFELLSRAPTNANPTVILAHEFRTLASMRHPNIISVLDYGFGDELKPFFTMNLLDEALTVDKAIETVSHEQKISYLIHTLQALTYLHRRGILHRDLKPSNVLVQGEQAYLLDFGLALDVTYARSHGDTAGTLAYLAPEILSGTPPSIASDLYSLGVMAYELLTGEHPYDTSTQSQLIQDLLLKPIAIENIKLDDATAIVIARLLSKAPEDRYETALDVIRALCGATNYPIPQETQEIRESFLVTATFVGRENELKMLRQALAETVLGNGAAWLIGGESGVGKSRLMDELRTHALVHGALTLRGQAVTGGGLPYQLWRDLIRHLLLMVEVSDEEAYILGTIVPDIEHLRNRSIPEYAFDNIAIQKRLPLIIINLLTEAAEQKPLVLLLEDLQWTNESLDILKQLLNQISAHPILIVANYRSDEASHLPEQLVNSQHMLLERLSQENIRKLSVGMLGKAGEQIKVIELIQRESEGNAFFIVEVVRALAEDAGQLSAIGRATLPGQVFAGGVQHIIKRRLDHLPDWAISPIQIAAINGRQIDQKLLNHLLPELDIELWLNVCSELAVFTIVGDNWQFAHDKLREHIRENLSLDNKHKIHQQVAETIEILHADNLENYAIQLLQHYAAAENTEKEAEYAILASDTILNFNPLEAHRYAKRAIALKAYQKHENPQQELARIHYIMGCASLKTSEYDRAKEELDISLNIYEKIADIHGAAVTKTVIGEWGYMMAQFDEAIPVLDSCLEYLVKNEDWRNAGYAYMNLGIIHAQQNHLEKSHDYFEKCLDLMQKTKDPTVITQALNNLAIVLEMQGQIDESFTMHEESLAIRRSIKDKHGIAYSLTNLSVLIVEQERYDEARAMQKEALQLVRELGNRKGESNILDSLGLLEFKLKNYELALSYFQESVQVGRAINNPFTLNSALRHLGQTHKELGKSDVYSYYYDALSVVQNTGLLPDKLSILFDLVEEQIEKDQKAKAIQWLVLILNHADAYRNIEEVQDKLEELEKTMDAVEYLTAYETGETLDLDSLIKIILQEYEATKI